MFSRLIIFLFVIMMALSAYGQNNYLKWLHDLREARADRDFAKQIRLYHEGMELDTVFKSKASSYYYIAVCYDSLRDETNARFFYRMSVQEGKNDFSYEKRHFVNALADIFIQEKAYDSALFYINHVLSTKSIRNMCGSARAESHTKLHYRRMVCLRELGLVDSAIRVFMPYAFMEWTNAEGSARCTEHLFENDYHCQVLAFIDLLRLRYSSQGVDRQILQAEQDFQFKIAPRPEGVNTAPGPWTQYHRIEAYFDFCGQRIQVLQGLNSYRKSDLEDKLLLAEERSLHMQYLTRSLLYMLLLPAPVL